MNNGLVVAWRQVGRMSSFAFSLSLSTCFSILPMVDFPRPVCYRSNRFSLLHSELYMIARLSLTVSTVESKRTCLSRTRHTRVETVKNDLAVM